MYERTATRYVIARDGTRIAWHTHLDPNDAPPPPERSRSTLLLTNGLGTTDGFWRHLVEGFAPTHRVIHWHYRGHGGSEPAARGDYAIRTQADDLARVTEAAMAQGDGTPPVHVGFSMGVSVLFELYRTRPDLVRAMVLIGGAPDAPYTHLLPMRIPGVLPAVRGALRTMTPVMSLVRPVWKALYQSPIAYPTARALKLVVKDAPRDEIEAFAHELGAMDPKVFWQTFLGLMGAKASDVMERVAVPTLIVAAEHDTLIPMRQVKRMRNAMARARFVRVARAGHAVLVEAGPDVVAALRTFLDEVDAPTPRATGT